MSLLLRQMVMEELQQYYLQRQNLTNKPKIELGYVHIRIRPEEAHAFEFGVRKICHPPRQPAPFEG